MILNLQQSNYWGVLESEEYRDRFDHHLPAHPIWRGLFNLSFQVLRRWRLNNLSEKHCLIKKVCETVKTKGEHVNRNAQYAKKYRLIF